MTVRRAETIQRLSRDYEAKDLQYLASRLLGMGSNTNSPVLKTASRLLEAAGRGASDGTLKVGRVK